MQDKRATAAFYHELSNIRELFHKYGSFDDSNAKLDEIAKYISIYVHQIEKPDNEISIPTLLSAYEEDKKFPLAKELKAVFSKIAESDSFKLSNARSVFGTSPSLNIKDEDNEFAYLLLKLVVNAVNSILNGSKNFDILNECFGHFVRDNFRNHVEDAQYMTPNEAVDLMCDIALEDLKEENAKRKGKFVLMDPCCGVGSFLSTFYHKNHVEGLFKESDLLLVGQDKVERMVRLSKINMVLANVPNHAISSGNSVAGDSEINNYVGKVDLILTNPPFGAKFTSSELKEGGKLKSLYPSLHDVILKNGANFSSEVLFVDRCLALLKPGGRLLAVLPDSVISSGGLNSVLRYRLANNPNYSIKAIIELPAVTFAQAGTRTKTSILYIQKNSNAVDSDRTFIGISDDIGFEVSTKKGATVKREAGTNDLPQILASYRRTKNVTSHKQRVDVISISPSCVTVEEDTLKENSWTPNHYRATKFAAVDGMASRGIEIVKLAELVSFGGSRRRKEQMHLDSKCISVLHVSDEDLNYDEIINYKPKYPGIVCRPGDILFSKINPRIMRIVVVPNLDYPLTCSSEFEIMNSTTELSNYAIKLLLMLPSVQAQVNSLTSGTSSSHNRIKTADLANILIPLPKKGTKIYEDFNRKAEAYEAYTKDYNNLKINMLNLKKDFFKEVA